MGLRQTVGMLLCTVVAGSAIAACGSGRAPYLFIATYDDAGTAPDGSVPPIVIVKPTVPKCSVPTSSVCDCVEVPLAAEPPNLYFVLDSSGSMSADNRWGNVRQSVLDLVRVIGPRAKFGAMVYPGAANDSCSEGNEVMPLRLGDAPAGTRGPTWNLLNQRTIGISPSGGTPTSATLNAVRTRLLGQAGKSFVILATDGGPNCNNKTTCGVEDCIPNIESYSNCTPNGSNCCVGANAAGNCLDGAATISAVSALRGAAIPTYVVGIPGSANYATLLGRLAEAGGTARTGAQDAYYRVDAQGQAALLTSMKKVVAQILASCTIELNKQPENSSELNVYLDEKPVPQDPVDGWVIEGKTVTLKGKTCASVLAGDVVDLRVIAGCPTEQPR